MPGRKNHGTGRRAPDLQPSPGLLDKEAEDPFAPDVAIVISAFQSAQWIPAGAESNGICWCLDEHSGTLPVRASVCPTGGLPWMDPWIMMCYPASPWWMRPTRFVAAIMLEAHNWFRAELTGWAGLAYAGCAIIWLVRATVGVRGEGISRLTMFMGISRMKILEQ